MESEAIKFDEYLANDLEKRFEFLYENYSIMKILIKDYKEDLITDVIEMKLYNRRAELGEPGVRIQVSRSHSSPTERQAINHMTIEKAVEEGFLDDDFFEGIDNRDEMIRRVTVYQYVCADYEVFSKKLHTLDPIEQRVLKPYLLREKTMNDLATDLGIDYRSAVKKIYRIRKRLSEIVEPRMQKGE